MKFGRENGKSSESVQCAMLKACDACADMGQLQRTVPIRKTFWENETP